MARDLTFQGARFLWDTLNKSPLGVRLTYWQDMPTGRRECLHYNKDSGSYCMLQYNWYRREQNLHLVA